MRTLEMLTKNGILMRQFRGVQFFFVRGVFRSPLGRSGQQRRLARVALQGMFLARTPKHLIRAE